MGRLLAICGWLAWQTRRPFGRSRIGTMIGSAIAPILAVVLAAVATLPIVLPLLEPQPEDATVQQIFDGTTAHADGWLRLRGRLTPLADSPTGLPGSFGLLIDTGNPLRAVVVESSEELEPTAGTAVTGTLAPAVITVDEELPIEATVAGTPPRVVPDRLVTLDATAVPPRVVSWPLSIPPLLLAGMLVVGARAGYPVFRPTADIDVLARPLIPGERVPSAYGGRIGENRADLTDPGGALLLVRTGPRGTLLTAQPLNDAGGPAPAPVLIGGGWTSGKVGAVHAVRESVAALHVRSELVDAIFLFARSGERDRVAALIATDR